MSKEINLDEFWNKKYPHGKLPKYAKDIIIEYSKELLELAAENAEIEHHNWHNQNDVDKYHEYFDDSGDKNTFKIHKQSILDVIDKIK